MRRFRFSLRTLILLITIVAIGSWWIAAQLRWIGERHRYVLVQHASSSALAPWPLWLFGEDGADEVLVCVYNPQAYYRARDLWPDELGAEDCKQFLSPADVAEIERAKLLFPETENIRFMFLDVK